MVNGPRTASGSVISSGCHIARPNKSEWSCELHPTRGSPKQCRLGGGSRPRASRCEQASRSPPHTHFDVRGKAPRLQRISQSLTACVYPLSTQASDRCQNRDDGDDHRQLDQCESTFHLKIAQLSRFCAACSPHQYQNAWLDSSRADELDSGAVDWDRHVAHPVMTVNVTSQRSRRNVFTRNRSPSWLTGGQHNAETQGGVAVAGSAAAAVRRAALRPGMRKTAAAPRAGWARERALRVEGNPAGVEAGALAPLPDIAVQVIQSPRVRQLLPDRMRHGFRIVSIPCEVG